MGRLTNKSIAELIEEGVRDEARIARGRCDFCHKWLEYDQPTALLMSGGFYHTRCLTALRQQGGSNGNQPTA